MVIAKPDDDAGPGFAFTVGLYLRTLQPETLIMGVPFEPSGRVLNAIGDYLMAGGEKCQHQALAEKAGTTGDEDAHEVDAQNVRATVASVRPAPKR